MLRVPNLPEPEFLAILRQIPAIVVDLGILQSKTGEVLFVRRGHEPFKGHWHLPGGFLGYDETFDQAVERILWLETGLTVKSSTFVGLFDYGRKDPRGRLVAAAYRVDPLGTPRARQGEEIQWFGTRDNPRDALDFQQPVLDACLGR